jgi:hypothetical protein
LSREKRIKTIRVLKDVGLLWMNCVEPVGPEHSVEEIVDLMLLARDNGRFTAASCGASIFRAPPWNASA